MKLWEGWPGRNGFCCFGSFLVPGKLFPSLTTLPTIIMIVVVFCLAELPRLPDFWKILVGTTAGLLLLGVILGFLQAMATEPGLHVRRSLLPALTVSSDGRETVLDLCRMYAAVSRPPGRPSEPWRPWESEERKKMQTKFAEDMEKEIEKMPCFEEADDVNEFEMRRVGARNHRSFICFLISLVVLGWIFLGVSVADGIANTRYDHLLSIQTTQDKVLAGLVSAAAMLVIGILCCQALKWCRTSHVDRAQVVLQLLLAVVCMAWVAFAAVFGVIPMVPLAVAIVIAPPTLGLTSMLQQQLYNLGRGLNVKQSLAHASLSKGAQWSFQTLIDWFRQGAPESIASLDAEVIEDVLEQGLATSPNPWSRGEEDDGLCPEIGIPWFTKFSPATYERMSDSPERCTCPPCREDNAPGVKGWNPNTGASSVVDEV
eukprot:s873_g6.t1